MKVYSSHYFLCGHLDAGLTEADFLKGNHDLWKKEEIDNDKYENQSCIYYKSFIDSLHSVKGKVSGDKTAHYVLNVNRECRLDIESDRIKVKGWHFDVLNLHVFLFPFGISLCAIEIEERGLMSADDLEIVHGCLREVYYYEANDVVKISAPEYMQAIEPLVRLCGKTDGCKKRYSCLVKTGNKLKVFQIVAADDNRDEALYELGTFSKYEGVSPAYFEQLKKENRISVFRNWTALSLFDSFTVLFADEKPDIHNWTECYFRLIYIHCMFQKTMLFMVNRKFRALNGSRKDAKECRKLLNDIRALEHRYVFSNISYNFLPQLIYKSVYNALDIDDERVLLRQYIEQESERRSKRFERNVSIFGILIACLTIFSAIYDGMSLLKDIFG